MTHRPAAWRYLELTYDHRDRDRVRLDGVLTTDGAAVGEVVTRLGLDGWEMVGSAAGDEALHVLWFKQAIEDAALVAEPGPASARVTLVGLGRGRSDPHVRRQLIDAVAELTGESGWRATRIVDKAPRVVVERVTADEADRIRQRLEALGATVEIG